MYYILQKCYLFRGSVHILKMESCVKLLKASQCDSHAEGGLALTGHARDGGL